jgi:glycerol-3-phosphate dehydrogenase
MRDTTFLTKGPYDLLIVGGGINGAALANMASLNGLSTALIEKNDFASGTSSKSTKLIHGGLRYLENLEFDLVYESLHERSIQIKSAPHLVKPISFVIPVYKNDVRPFWMMRLGVYLYDVLSGTHRLGKRKKLSVEEVQKIVPDIKKEGLLGGLLYFDAQMNDARLCLENILSAKERGAHVANYVEARSLIKENGKTVGVIGYDSLGDKILNIRAKQVVCAMGPWTNPFIEKDKGPHKTHVRTTKGVHLVYRDTFSEKALFLTTQKDRRIFFVIPWYDHSLIGTTDTDYNGPADEVSADDNDIDYLLEQMKRFFPSKNIKRERILTTFAGLRPLVSNEGKPSALSRKHVLEKSYSGVLYVIGGKYTTYRKIAEDVLREIIQRKPRDTKGNYPIYGGGKIEGSPEQAAEQYGVDVNTVQYLMSFYGSRYTDVLKLFEQYPQSKKHLCTCSPAIIAQVIYAIETELAQTKEDIIERRLRLQYLECSTRQCYTEIDHILRAYKNI